MEILSYVVSGALQHKDTLGTGSVIRPGEVQLMSAGSGIAHSEKNASTEATVEFLQIWLLPAESGSAPSYQQKDFGDRPGLLLVVSPDGRGGSLTVKQDADVYRALLALGDSVTLQRRGARAWVQVVHGPLEVNGVLLQPGDGLKVDQPGPLHLTAHGAVNALLFDLA
jgi:redox-sensitive bicupin YhaK (pirin superfamily)